MSTLVVPITEYFTLNDFGLNPRSHHRPPDYTPFKKLCTDLNQLFQQLLDQNYPHPVLQNHQWFWFLGREKIWLACYNSFAFTESAIQNPRFTKDKLIEFTISCHCNKPPKHKWTYRQWSCFLSIEMMYDGGWVFEFGRKLQSYLNYLQYGTILSK
jgi:hypothetical protein